MRKLIFILAALFAFTVPVQAADLTWSFTTPAGTVDFTSPELDVTAPNATDTHYDRFINWACSAYALTNDNGTPEDPSDDFPVGCATNGTKAQHVQAWMRAQWRGTRSNVLRWEQQQRRISADNDEQELPTN